eukprot:6186408-Pleurochrysis_carterae.AAC.1
MCAQDFRLILRFQGASRPPITRGTPYLCFVDTACEMCPRRRHIERANNERELLNLMSPKLQAEVALHVNREVLAK